MPYKAYPTNTVAVLLKKYKELAVERKKAVLPGTKTEAQKKLDGQGLELKNHLQADMKGIRKNFEDHSAKIDKLKTNSDQAVNLAKQSLAEYLKTPNRVNQGELDKLVGCLNTCGASLDDAKEDALAFGKAWFEYRGLSGLQGEVDDKFVKEFAVARSTLMVDQKEINLKTEQMQQNIHLVEALMKQARGTQKKNILDCHKEAQFMEKKVSELMGEIRDSRRGFEGKMKSLAAGANGNDAIADVHPYDALLADMKSSSSIWAAKLNSMKTTYSSVLPGLKGLENEDTIKGCLANAQNAIKEASNLHQMSLLAVTRSGKDLEKIHNKHKFNLAHAN